MKKTLKLLTILICCAPFKTVVANPPPQNPTELEKIIQLYQPEACKISTSKLCQGFNEFIAGDVPQLPEGSLITVGQDLTKDTQNTSFIVLVTKKSGNQIELNAFLLKTESEEEKQDTLQFIEELKRGQRNSKRSISRFLESSFRNASLMKASLQEKSFLYSNPAPPLPNFLRQKGKTLYLLGITLAPKFSGSFDRVPKIGFASFPIP